jgi:uncharacterized protein YndB with AHSA1/START domain
MSNSTITTHAPTSDRMLVHKSLVVAASPERAFEVFTKELSAWWPLASHHIGKVDPKEAVMEPFVGGRWFERGVDGSECVWGRVLAWEPPRRLVLTWDIDADWQADASIATQVEVRFIAEGGMTRVELEHRLLDRYGARAAEMRGILDSEGGWTGLLAAFGNRCTSAS